jgi:hypothetical protein
MQQPDLHVMPDTNPPATVPVRRTPARFPGTVRTAGAIWIAFGCLCLLFYMGMLVLSAAVSLEPWTPRMMRDATELLACSGILLGPFAAAFVIVGVQTVTGIARGTGANAAGSIMFGVFAFALTVALAAREEFGQASVGLVAGCSLVAAGILALLGRKDYHAWRQA